MFLEVFMSQAITAIIPVKKSMLTTSFLFSLHDIVMRGLSNHSDVKVVFGGVETLYFTFVDTQGGTPITRQLTVSFGCHVDKSSIHSGHKVLFSLGTDGNEQDIERVVQLLKQVSASFPYTIVDDLDVLLSQSSGHVFVLENEDGTVFGAVPNYLSVFDENSYVKLKGFGDEHVSLAFFVNTCTVVASDLKRGTSKVFKYSVAMPVDQFEDNDICFSLDVITNNIKKTQAFIEGFGAVVTNSDDIWVENSSPRFAIKVGDKRIGHAVINALYGEENENRESNDFYLQGETV
jgi:hypothetical protein